MAAPARAQGSTPSPTAATQPPHADSPAGKSAPIQVDKALATAKAKAAETGKRVPLPSRYTETMKVWANTDGKTLHAELSTEPVQLEVPGKDGKKSWQPVDTTIVTKDDGTLAAKLVKTPLTFGGEGATTLVTAKDKDGTVTIGWDRKLPKPAVDGNTITYRDAVAKGADLVLTARPNGFTQDVVLRTRPQGPVKVSLPVTLPKGKSYGKARDGRPQLMSAQGAPESAPLMARAVDAKAVEAPEQGKIGKVDTSVTTEASGKSSLVLTPDAAFLADASVTYPVTVSLNGDWIGAGDSSDTFVSSVQYPNSATLSTWLRAGRSADGELWRTYLRYVINGTDLDYATIRNADLRLWNYHANACGSTVGVGIVARRLTSAYHYSTLTWANQPSSTGTDAVVAPGGYSATLAGCSGSGELYHSIENIVQAWADGTPDHGLMIRATTEGAGGANWRQYRSDQYTGSDGRGPVLFINYEPAPTRVITYERDGLPDTAIPTYSEIIENQVSTDDSPDIPTASLEEAIARLNESTESYSIEPEVLETVPDEPEEEPGPDVTPPAVTGTDPVDGATDVTTDSKLSVLFSEPVTGAQLAVRDGAGSAVAGTASMDAENVTMFFTPASSWAGDTEFTAEVTGGQDAAGNPLPTYSWSFATGTGSGSPPDTTPPSVASTTPAEGTTGVAVDTQVTVSFSEPVTNAQVRLTDATGAAISGSATMDSASTTLTFDPDPALAHSTSYIAEASGATDAAGNAMTTHSWSFTTGVAAPTTTINANPSFESGVDPWYSWWPEDDLTRSTEHAHDGRASAKLVAPGCCTAIAQDIQASEGTYRLTGWIRAENAADVWYGVDWYDADWNLLESAYDYTEPSVGAWSPLTDVTVSAPAGTAYGIMLAEADFLEGASSSTIYLDGLRMTPVTEAGSLRATGRRNGEAPKLIKDLREKIARYGKSGRDVAAVDDAAPMKAAAPVGFVGYGNNGKHIEFADCWDEPKSSSKKSYPHGWTKNPYNWCSARTIGKARVIETRVPCPCNPNAKYKTVDKLEFRLSVVGHTFAGGKKGTPNAEIDVANGSINSRTMKFWTYIDKIEIAKDGSVHRYKPPLWTEGDTIGVNLSVGGAPKAAQSCARVHGDGQTKTIATWRSPSAAQSYFEFVSDKTHSSGGVHQMSTCRVTPVVWVRESYVETRMVDEFIRCDTSDELKTYYGGCAFVAHVPTYVMPLMKTKNVNNPSGLDESAAMIYTMLRPDLTKSTYPRNADKTPIGTQASGSPLHRSSSGTRETRNRTQSLRFCVEMLAQIGEPKPNNHDCDEYPFAATHEGSGSDGKGGLDDPKGTRIVNRNVVVDYVWHQDNRSVGSRVEKFWGIFRVLGSTPNGDDLPHPYTKFWVDTSRWGNVG